MLTAADLFHSNDMILLAEAYMEAVNIASLLVAVAIVADLPERQATLNSHLIITLENPTEELPSKTAVGGTLTRVLSTGDVGSVLEVHVLAVPESVRRLAADQVLHRMPQSG